MFFDKPMVLHSTRDDGRHWLTTMDIPPLQIWPVARNHCRAGHFLATLVAAKLAALKGDVSEEMTLSRADIKSVNSLSKRYPELKTEGGDVSIRLLMMKGPEGNEFEDEEDEDDGPVQFITPQPPQDWTASYDQWIVHVGRQLGVDVPEPADETGYEKAMANAAVELQQQLPSLRKRFLAGMDGLNLGFKIGLTTQKGGKEYVWVRPTSWQEESVATCVLESQPRDCQGYKLGQTLDLPVAELLDYAIGSPKAGIVEPGLTQRIAEDYGLVIM